MTGGPVSFAGFRVDPAARELWKEGHLVELPPHVFDFLCHLIAHRDRAVGRDELVAVVWGKTQVSDTLLGQTVMRIRRELGDDGKDQRILRTVPRFGYRWVAEVVEQVDHPPATMPQGAVEEAEADAADASDIPATVETLRPGDLLDEQLRRHPRALVLARSAAAGAAPKRALADDVAAAHPADRRVATFPPSRESRLSRQRPIPLLLQRLEAWSQTDDQPVPRLRPPSDSRIAGSCEGCVDPCHRLPIRGGYA